MMLLETESRRSSQLVVKASSSEESTLDTNELVEDLKQKVTIFQPLLKLANYILHIYYFLQISWFHLRLVLMFTVGCR